MWVAVESLIVSIRLIRLFEGWNFYRDWIKIFGEIGGGLNCPREKRNLRA